MGLGYTISFSGSLFCFLISPSPLLARPEVEDSKDISSLAFSRLRVSWEASRGRFRTHPFGSVLDETNSRNEDAKKSYPKIGPAQDPKKDQIRTGPGGAKFPDSAAVKICVLFNKNPV